MHLYVRLDQIASWRFFMSLQYRKQNKDLDKTKMRIMEIANYVDKVRQAWVNFFGSKVFVDCLDGIFVL